MARAGGPLEPRVLTRPEPAGLQFDRGQFGALALDRIEQRTPKGLGFDVALDEVILRAGGHCGYSEVLVVQLGQHDDREAWIACADALQGVDPVGVGQVQVQQHAVRTLGCQFALSIGNRWRPSEIDIDNGIGDHVFTDNASARSFSTRSTDRRGPLAARATARLSCGYRGARIDHHVLHETSPRSR